MATAFYNLIAELFTNVIQLILLYYLQKVSASTNQRKLHDATNNGFDKAAQFALNGCGGNARAIINDPELQSKFVTMGTTYVKQYIPDSLREGGISTDKDFQDRLLARLPLS